MVDTNRLDPPEASTAVEELPVGTVIRQSLRLDAVLGAGGMGVVYAATHLNLHVRKAVKVLKRSVTDREGVVERFKREGQTASHLADEKNLPGVVRVEDLGEQEGWWFAVMPLLKGRTLARRIADEGRLAVEEAVRVAREALATLGPLHAEGVIHRDIKPENIFLIAGSDGVEHPHILDFGIASVIPADADQRLTRGNDVLGTAMYMAPEQALRPTEIDARCDLHALGATLFEMLTGVGPVEVHEGDTAVVVLARVLVDERVRRNPRAFRPEVSEDLDAVVARSFAHNRDKRFARAEDLREALRAAMETPVIAPTEVAPPPVSPEPVHKPTPPVAPSVAPRPRGAPRALVLLAVLLTAGLAALTLAWRFRGPPEVTFSTGSDPSVLAALRARCLRISPASECRDEVFAREAPPRKVRLSAFRIDPTEVTHEDFVRWLATVPGLRYEPGGGPSDGARFADARGTLVVVADADRPSTRAGGVVVRDGRPAVRDGHARRPAVLMVWRAAKMYCESRGARLPTEAEWEYSARGATGRTFPWGEAEPDRARVAFMREASVDVGTSGDRSLEGVFDLGGNVSEWVADAMAVYSACQDECRDPVVESAPGGARVVRGGAWSLGGDATRGAARGSLREDQAAHDVGFRCVERPR